MCTGMQSRSVKHRVGGSRNLLRSSPPHLANRTASISNSTRCIDRLQQLEFSSEPTPASSNLRDIHNA